MSNAKPLTPRTARTPRENEQQYVIADGAPKHYVDGYGLVGSGAIVTLAPGVDPGKWYVEISPEDADKANASESDRQRLAVLAAAKIKVGGNAEDKTRKQQIDKAVLEQRDLELVAAAQREADAMAATAAAQAKAQEEADKVVAERQRAESAESELSAARQQLAAVQTELEQLKKTDDKAGSAKPGNTK